MTRRSDPTQGGWGPQASPTDRKLPRTVASVAVVAVAFSSRPGFELVLACALLVVVWRLGRRVSGSLPVRGARGARLGDGDPLVEVVARSRALGGGVYLGVDRGGEWRLARPERAVLVLGPPRSGKTSTIITPALIAHDGPAVSTSTKPDVLAATCASRSRVGKVWRFDPTGTAGPAVPGTVELRWSPVGCSRKWDGAMLMARSMVLGAGVGHGTTEATHWSRRAQALLGPLLHAAAISELGIDQVHAWVLGHDLESAGELLAGAGAQLAAGQLTGVVNTEARERSSICSAAADALDAYSSTAALAAASDPNFDAEAFVRSDDTMFIHAPAERQQLAAPLVCGLLAEIRAATYRAHAIGELNRRLLFALDEVANIAPLAELPAIASEGGSQGLVLLAALQDLSQARARWGSAADGFLTLFGSKLLLPGVADHQTLESVSVALGEYDRETVSTTREAHGLFGRRSRTVSSQRQRVLSPGEIANVPAGHALHLDGVAWELLELTPAHLVEPWRRLSGGGAR